ncbi:VanW family protein [Peribacillus loiseleuriae]|uniref:Vancomycin resistance protein n=1 Tax=Peribacillus loiseleuriae TaxID=1679170 RepID=A0A0K9GX84_9BACI|nr:VanW family protein [Peribacillus loiseleuriae]KMY51309.1 hypothetical protein AC625_18605 [Peribacillus loiseleuriae]
MKKYLVLFAVIAMVGGLVLHVKHGEAATHVKPSEVQGVGQHTKHGLLLSKKEWVEQEITLIDSRDGREIQKIKPSSFNSEEKAASLARELEQKYDQPMVPARLNSDGTMKAGSNRVVVDKAAFVTMLQNVTFFQREIEVPITESAPNITAEAAANVNQDVLASYKTHFNASIKGRTTNIVLSAKEIDGVILGPGDRFYYNLVVGEATAERGYQKAMEIVNKEMVEGIGGGICQTSSTLYNAIDKLGLEIVELHHHSLGVSYVPVDRDATVAYGGKDFKFLNNKDFPVMIKAIVDTKNGTLEVQVRAADQSVAKKG